MRSSNIKPISYLKANAAEVLKQLAEEQEPLVITQNGEAKAVLQDVHSYEQTQETLALLKVLALGTQEVEAGQLSPLNEVEARLAELGIHDYRQVFYKPYRIIYQTLDRHVLIYLVADGRRDMQRLLTRRLLG